MMLTDADAAMPPGGDVCPQCSARVVDGQRFCEICGYALVLSEVTCAKCLARFARFPQARRCYQPAEALAS